MQLVLIKIQELNSKMEQEKSTTEARISDLILDMEKKSQINEKNMEIDMK